MNPNQPFDWRRPCVGAALIAAIVFSLSFLLRLPDQVFFSGDGGVKLLVVQQFARGDFGVHLSLAAPSWVKALWDNGLFPFAPPFVYRDEAGHVVSFPIAFAALSAPFYTVLGFRGLYVVPIVSLWVLWLRFSKTLRVLKLPASSQVLAITLLVFGTHLTLYGAMFWEHTLGAMLAFVGFEFLATTWAQRWSDRRAFLYGAVTALSFLIRSESICLLAAFVLVAGFMFSRTRARPFLAFIAGIGLSLALILAFNRGVYGHALGIHSLQVIEQRSLIEQFQGIGNNARRMIESFLVHVPVTLFVVAVLAWRLVRGELSSLRGLYGVLIAAGLFLVAVPIIAPNAGGKELGPRYLLALVPVLALAAGALLAPLRAEQGGLARATLLSLLALTFLSGVYQNTFVNHRRLFADYRERVAPALALLQRAPTTTVAVTHTYIAQELAASFGQKAFLLADNVEKLARVADAVAAQNERSFIVLSIGNALPARFSFAPGGRVRGLTLHRQGAAGIYYFHRAVLEDRQN